MKKHLFLLIGLLAFCVNSPADAKTFKLGRGALKQSFSPVQINPGNNNGNDIITTCPTGQCKSGGKCISISNAPCEYNTGVDSDGNCICQTPTCNLGEYLSPTGCKGLCSGVTCKNGYRAVANVGENKCCCEEGLPPPPSSCGPNQVYNPIVNACVNAVCPIHCSEGMCDAGYCTVCDSGYYMNSNGMCPACSSAIEGCTKCSGIGSSVTCTRCGPGYTLKNGNCFKDLPTVVTCGEFEVYHPFLGHCVEAVCPSNCSNMCTEGYCSSCNKGYTLSNDGKCIGDALIPSYNEILP